MKLLFLASLQQIDQLIPVCPDIRDQPQLLSLSGVPGSVNSMALLNKYLCIICHQLLLHNSQALHDYCLLYTLAFRPNFLYQLWAIITSSLSTPFQYIGGIRPPLYSLHSPHSQSSYSQPVQQPSNSPPASATSYSPPEPTSNAIEPIYSPIESSYSQQASIPSSSGPAPSPNYSAQAPAPSYSAPTPAPSYSHPAPASSYSAPATAQSYSAPATTESSSPSCAS